MINRRRMNAVGKIKVLELRANIHCVALLVSFPKCAFKHAARIALKRCAGRRLNVTKHVGNGLTVVFPRQYLKRCGVGKRQQIRLRL